MTNTKNRVYLYVDDTMRAITQPFGCSQWVGCDEQGRKCRAPEIPRIKREEVQHDEALTLA